MLVIENVPVVSCRKRGEGHLTADTLHEGERLKLYQKSLAVQRPLKTIAFAESIKPRLLHIAGLLQH